MGSQAKWTAKGPWMFNFAFGANNLVASKYGDEPHSHPSEIILVEDQQNDHQRIRWSAITINQFSDLKTLQGEGAGNIAVWKSNQVSLVYDSDGIGVLCPNKQITIGVNFFSTATLDDIQNFTFLLYFKPRKLSAYNLLYKLLEEERVGVDEYHEQIDYLKEKMPTSAGVAIVTHPSPVKRPPGLLNGLPGINPYPKIQVNNQGVPPENTNGRPPIQQFNPSTNSNNLISTEPSNSATDQTPPDLAGAAGAANASAANENANKTDDERMEINPLDDIPPIPNY